jgi:hypothetical protein
MQAALQCGKAVLSVYRQNMSFEIESDAFPVNPADRLSHEVISILLVNSGAPLISGEGRREALPGLPATPTVHMATSQFHNDPESERFAQQNGIENGIRRQGRPC